MDKWQSVHAFWSGFGIPAYDANTVPDDAVMPYVTYEAVVGPFESPVLLTGDLWYAGTSWADASRKADEVGRYLRGYRVVALDGGEYLLLSQGLPFAQRLQGESDTVRRIHINVTGEFLAHY